MGVHSTLFGPVKYAILPQHLQPEELVGGNGLVEMGTFVAILLGTIAGGAARRDRAAAARARRRGSRSRSPSPAMLVSRGIPHTPAVAPDLAINWNPFTETWRNLRFAHGNRVVWLSMLGISWFWFYGATFLAQFAGFAQATCSAATSTSSTLLLALFSVGIGVGLAAVRAAVGTQGRDRPRAVRLDRPDVFAVDLWLASRDLHATGLAGVDAFFAQPAHWRVVADLVLIGLFGGFYIVPLYALIQERSDAVAPLAHHRRQQHPERDLHGRVGGHRASALLGAGPVDPAAVPRHRR